MSVNHVLNDQQSERETHRALRTEREGILRANLLRLNDRYSVSEEAIEHWKSQDNEVEASDEYLTSICQQHLTALEPVLKEISQSCRGPIILEGVNPPWLFEALLNAPHAKGHPSFRQRILVLQSDPIELLEGLSFMELGERLNDQRVQFFVGEDASEKLLEWASQRIDDAPPAIVIQNSLLKCKAAPDAHAIMRTIDSRWSINESELEAKIQSRTSRDSRWWVERFRAAKRGAEPLRVLIPVSRHTTYLKYAAADAARAFEKIGCQTQVLIEADDSAMMSKCNGLRAAIDFDPDLILATNYTRPALSPTFPKDIPHVCWIQDAMAHLLDKKTISLTSELDMFVGMVDASMIENFGYPKNRTRWMPMASSRSKFVSLPQSDQFISEIAWVTHQSESTETMKQRLIEDMRIQAPNVVEPFAAMLDEVEQFVLIGSKHPINNGINKLIDKHLFPSGVPDSVIGLRNNLLKVLVFPFAERVYRHQTVQWAGDIAQRRGWRFKLYGNGWENHPDFAQYASGPLEHNVELRECYRSSAIHLHASLGQMMHQRVSECFFSGGLPLSRVTMDSFGLVSLQLIAQFVRELDSGTLPKGAVESDGVWQVPFESCPRAHECINELLRFGYRNQSHVDEGAFRWTSRHLKHGRAMLDSPQQAKAAEMFANTSDLGFDNESQLESLVDRALTDSIWRETRIKDTVSAMPKELTIEGFVENVLEFVESTLESLAQ